MASRLEAIAALTGGGQEYEIVPCESWGRSCRMFKQTPENLRQLFESCRSDETFIVYEGERYTFDETQRRVARIANILVSHYGICRVMNGFNETYMLSTEVSNHLIFEKATSYGRWIESIRLEM